MPQGCRFRAVRCRWLSGRVSLKLRAGVAQRPIFAIPELLSEIVYMDIAIAVSDLALMGGWPDGTLRVRRSEQVKLYF